MISERPDCQPNGIRAALPSFHGQLHKGGKNNGLFIVLSQDEQSKLEIPGEGITFNDDHCPALGDTLCWNSMRARGYQAAFFGRWVGTTLIERIF